MSPVLMKKAELAEKLGDAVPVGEPLGELLAATRVARAYGQPGHTSAGLWECSPGRWRRQIRQAEFCYFIEGDLTFEPEQGDPIHITAGDAVFFPADSGGIWDIRRTARKFYVMFDPATTAPAV